MKLTESLHEVYEPDWYGREDVKMVGEVRAGHRAREAQRGFPAGPTMSYSLTSWSFRSCKHQIVFLIYIYTCEV